MSEILLVNPTKKHKRRRASAAQLAALKRGRAIRASHLKHKGVTSMKKNATKRRKRRAVSSTLKSVKHKGRPASRSAFHAAGYARNPTRKRSRKYQRNPAFRPMGFVKETLMPSLIGAGGALGLELAMAYLPIPITLKTGPFKPLVRIAGAVGIGFLASMAMGKRAGGAVGAGALTVVLYDEIKQVLKKQMPTLPLTGLGDYPSLEYVSPAIQAGDTMSAYVDGVGMYDDQYS